LTNNTAYAFSPAGISSFFQICDRTPNGRLITDLNHVGARGGGFGIQRGIHTQVQVADSEVPKVQVFINGNPAPQAKTTQTAVQMLMAKLKHTCSVTVKHRVEVPIGAGFGTSAAGALTASMALANALGLPLTFNQVGQVAHSAEIECKTGLGTVGPLMLGGCILSIEPGGPGTAIIDRIPLPSNYVIVAGVFDTTLTKDFLSANKKRQVINNWGKKTLEAILDEPSIEKFLECSLEFARRTGFITNRVENLAKIAEKAGAIGSAQNMLGEALHAVTTEKEAANVVEAFKEVLPNDRIIASRIDFQGARLSLVEEV
jgi:pantoate kinase